MGSLGDFLEVITYMTTFYNAVNFTSIWFYPLVPIFTCCCFNLAQIGHKELHRLVSILSHFFRPHERAGYSNLPLLIAENSERLFYQHHLPYMHALTSLEAVEINACRYRLSIRRFAFPNHPMGAC